MRRRTFLKGAMALSGLAALGGAGCAPSAPSELLASTESEVPTPPEEQIFQGLCRGNCGGGCRLNVHVREGKVVQTTPVLNEEDPLENLICPRGYAHPQRIYAPERIQYPMRRKEGSVRGDDNFERVSWDEAIAEICEKWTSYREQYGNSSLGYSYGAGTYAQNYYMYLRLFTSLGAMDIKQENDMVGLNYSWRIFGMSLYLVGNCRKDEANAKTIFCWACNASIGTLARWKYMNEAMRNGARLIVIDPIYTDAAAKADLWVPIKPGTDAALAMAMVKYWIDNGTDDKDYLAAMTVAPFLVREDTGQFLRAEDLGIEVAADEGNASSTNSAWSAASSEVKTPAMVMGPDGEAVMVNETSEPVLDGVFEVSGIPCKTAYRMVIERFAEWTPERAAEVCDISADLVRELAEAYLDGPTVLHYGWGNDHWGNGCPTCHAQYLLPLFSGQIGKPGTGIQGSCGGSTTGFAGDNWTVTATSHYTPGTRTTMTYLPQIVDEKMWNGEPCELKSIFFYCCNPVAGYSGGTEIRRALDQVELIVTADTVWNDTTLYSDIVLPVPHWFEYETYRTCPSDYIDFNDKAVDPPFECKPDTEIISLLGKGMGLNDAGEFDFTNESIHAMFLDSDIAREYGISWEVLKEQKHMPMAPVEYYYGSAEFPFATASGRAEFYIEDAGPEFDFTKEVDGRQYALPFYKEPLEAYDGNPLKEKYPFTFMTHRDRFKVHTAFAKCPWFLEIQPEPTIEINPDDAERLGVAEGDMVRVHNDRGEVVLRAHLDASMRPGVTWTEHTWLQDQYVRGRHADVASLAANDLYPSNHPYDCLVAIEKYEEA